ncbi:UDP-glucuronosyl/UDP-glucosyltransferase [Corchorus capsularis]|uniref:Glycosyltransferase n=1 Tax=Corchorus capsularis TaxID=210143 RepID=A0A1R3GIJ3_COCAP|nr:UDP-glucuronosyl/UDP-glucosyltransferase [Corchorus capsularis]
MDAKQKKISVLMFPWLAYGHISPFLELAKKLSKRNFHIFFCSTPINLNTIKPKLSPKYSQSIEFVDFHLQSLPDLPPHYHTTNGLPPHLMNTLKKAFDMSSLHFSKILKTLNPDLLIYDFILPWAPLLALSNKIPAVHFLCTSATVSSFLVHALKKPCEEEFPFPKIYYCFLNAKFNNKMENCSGDDGISDIDRTLQSFERSMKIILVKTFEELEGKFMDYLSVLLNKKIVPTGPLIQDPNEDEGDDDERTKIFLEWLNKKGKSSTVFVSFGSEYFLDKEEREEIAYGLELSKVNFIWVIRFPIGENKTNLDEALPQGFLQRVGERGLVVENWAPQAKILQHSSIGGFVSHCGWSSVMESLKFGVPIIAIPMHLDQPLNARLVVDVGVGLEVRRNHGSLEREEIAKLIKEVVLGNGNDGEIVRRKAREMSNHIKKKGEKDMDELVEELMLICKMKPNSCHLS